jgi:hypothetical protein
MAKRLCAGGLDAHWSRSVPRKYLCSRGRVTITRPVRDFLASHWAGEKLVLTELEGRFRDASFCCARWNDVASERSLSPPCEGGAGGVMREHWKSRAILLASQEECERTERERAWEDLVTGRAATTPPCPPLSQGGEKGATKWG